MTGRPYHAVVEIDPAELAIRLCEAHICGKRPPGTTAAEALETMDEEIRLAWLRSARAAAEYLAELINSAREVN